MANFGLSPILHNFVSYAGASAVFAMALPTGASAASAGALMWHAHFLRRALETCFLFRFSGTTVALEDSAMEFVYYWGFAVWIASSAPGWPSTSAGGGNGGAWRVVLGLALWGVSEYFNFRCHVALARNPKHSGPGGKRQRVDKRHGCLFGSVTSPHYLFEMCSWMGFNVATGAALPGLVFMALGALIMTCYAIVRHEAAQHISPSNNHTPVFPFGIDVRPPKPVIEALA